LDDCGEWGWHLLIVPVTFESEVKTVPLGAGTIQIENLTPISSEEDERRRRRELETLLFDVFSKYMEKREG